MPLSSRVSSLNTVEAAEDACACLSLGRTLHSVPVYGSLEFGIAQSVSEWQQNGGGIPFLSGAMIFLSLLRSCLLWSPCRALYNEYRLLFSRVKTRADTRIYLVSTL